MISKILDSAVELIAADISSDSITKTIVSKVDKEELISSLAEIILQDTSTIAETLSSRITDDVISGACAEFEEEIQDAATEQVASQINIDSVAEKVAEQIDMFQVEDEIVEKILEQIKQRM